MTKRGGLSTLAEIINKANQTEKNNSAGAVSVSVYLQDTGTDWARVCVSVCPGWACGVSGRVGKYYQINPREVWHFAELPAIVDPGKFIQAQNKINKLIQKAESIRAECLRVAKSAGVVGYCEIIQEIKKGK